MIEWVFLAIGLWILINGYDAYLQRRKYKSVLVEFNNTFIDRQKTQRIQLGLEPVITTKDKFL